MGREQKTGVFGAAATKVQIVYSCNSICAATLAAITDGALPVMPGKPIGQVMC